MLYALNSPELFFPFLNEHEIVARKLAAISCSVLLYQFHSTDMRFLYIKHKVPSVQKSNDKFYFYLDFIVIYIFYYLIPFVEGMFVKF